MMTNEKLEKIKNRINGKHVGIYDDVCKGHDVNWLIEQAEKVERLEEENRQMREAIAKVKDAVANDVFAVLAHLPKQIV